MARVLFVCLHNAGRSQMSGALFERAGDGRHEADSAGTTPGDRVHPEVVEAMGELGMDLSGARRSDSRATGRLGRRRRDDGLRRRLPLHPGQALHRLGSRGSEGPPDRGGARDARRHPTARVDELVAELDGN